MYEAAGNNLIQDAQVMAITTFLEESLSTRNRIGIWHQRHFKATTVDNSLEQQATSKNELHQLFAKIIPMYCNGNGY